MKKFIFIDIETTNEQLDFEIDKSELIELWAYDYISKKEFSCYVKVGHPLSEFTKRLCTWITDENVKWWKSGDEAVKDFVEFLWPAEDVVLVGHNIEWFDLAVLNRYDPDYFNKVQYLDTLQLFLLLYPWYEDCSVQWLYKKFVNQEYKEDHRALQDAIDEQALFDKVFSKEYLTKSYNDQSKSLEFLDLIWKANKDGLKKNTNSHLLSMKDKEGQNEFKPYIENNYIFEYIDELLGEINTKDSKTNLVKQDIYEKFLTKFDYEKLKETEYEYPEMAHNTNEAEMLNVYKDCLWDKPERPQQLKIINKINSYISNSGNTNHKKLLWIEAGTGTGKTYGYLIPAMQFLDKNPKYKVFVATYTKVLQGQIMKEDIHTLWDKFNDVKYCQLKANSEWLDLNSIPLKSNLMFYDIILRQWIYRWSYYHTDIHYGVISKFDFKGKHSKYIYNFLTSKSRYDYNKDYWFKGKLQYDIHNHNLFVVNHAFLLSQFGWYSKDNALTWFYNQIIKNPKFRYYTVFDEWHNFEMVTRDYYSLVYDTDHFTKIIDFLTSSKWGFKELSDDLLKSIFNKDIPDDIKNETKIVLDWMLEWNKEKNLDALNAVTITWLLTTWLYHLALPKIKELRTKYSIDELVYSKKELYDYYLSDWNNPLIRLLNNLHQVVLNNLNTLKELIWKIYTIMDWLWIDHDNIQSDQIINQLSTLEQYALKGRDFLTNMKSDWYFIQVHLLFNEWMDTVKNFWFTMIPRSLIEYTDVIKKSQWSLFLSATLFDAQWQRSYIMHELWWNIEWWNQRNYETFEVISAPFNYTDQRTITIPHINLDVDSEIIFQQKARIVLEKIREYEWRTLILTTNNNDKNKIANYLYHELNSEWIMIKKHEWWTMSSISNQRNIQALIDNPRTVLIGSKSYMEWVDIPWPNLSLVVLWKLPFLPPSPFTDFMNNKPDYTRIGLDYVGKFQSWVLFRQAIGRLIRTMNDTWEILILDPRINNHNGRYFLEYLDQEVNNNQW